MKNIPRAVARRLPGSGIASRQIMETGQTLPVRVHQTSDRITITAPMPGMEPENIAVKIHGDRVAIHGEERGPHQRDLPLVIAEWTVGPYYRELDLPHPVDGSLANATYGNGVLVVAMPKVRAGHPGVPAEFRLMTIGGPRGERVGHAGRRVEPRSTEEHWREKHARTFVKPTGFGTYRRILVPLDGSEEAEAILPLVEGLIEPSQGEVVLLSVIIPMIAPAIPDLPAPVIIQAEEEVRAEMEQYLSRIAQTLTAKGVRVRTTTRTGDPARRIVEAARELSVDLIAMTTHGRRGLERVLLGSTAEAVVRDSPVPVLLIRASADAARATKTAA